MAIAVRPSAVHPQSDRVASPRRFAISAAPVPPADVWPSETVDAAGPEHVGPEELLALAVALASRAQSWPGMTSPARRCWDLMMATEHVEAWVIAWPPGGAIELHDHGGSSGAVVVAVGELVETSIVSLHSGGAAPRTRRMKVGGSTIFPGSHVHDVANAGPAAALSVHVYSPRLTSMTYYRVIDGVPRAGGTNRALVGRELMDRDLMEAVAS